MTGFASPMTRGRGIVAPRRAAALAVGVAALVALGFALAAGDVSAGARPHCAGGRATLLVDPVKLFARGTQSDDVISGTSASERIIGRRGDDRACAHAGRDLVKAGPGADHVRSGSGRDKVHGGTGKDRLWSGTGDDKIKAADGAPDRVMAGKGADRVKVRDGVKDTVNCGPGRDAARIDNLDRLRSCNLVTLEPNPGFALPSWSDGQWSDPSNHQTIVAGDIDGDGVDELLGRGPLGIEAYTFCGADPPSSKAPCGGLALGQWLPLYNGGAPALTDDSGWGNPAYYSTIQTADLDGDRRDELLARGPNGLRAWRFNGASASCSATDNGGCWSELPTNTALDDPSWAQPQYYSTIQAADLEGDGGEEVIARAADGLHEWRFANGGWSELPALGELTDPSWAQPQYYSTIQTGDLDGDGKDEVIARAADGVHEWGFANGGWSELPALGELTDPSWAQPQYYSTIQTGDIDGDNKDDVLARAADGLHEWQFQNGAWRPLPDLPAFQDSINWDRPQYYSTIQTARLTQLPIDFVVGRGPDGLEAYGFPDDWEKRATLGDMSDAVGWDAERYYSTIMPVRGLAGSGTEAIVGRGLVGVQSYGYDGRRDAWGNFSAQFPSFDSGEAHTAYMAINAELSPNVDLRQRYRSMDTHDFDSFRTTLANMPQPPNVPDIQVWNQVKGQIDTELANGGNAADWYENYLRDIATEIFIADSLDASRQRIWGGAKSNAELVLAEWQLFQGVIAAISGAAAAAGPEATVVGALVAGAVSGGLGAPNVDQAIDGLEAQYGVLLSRLQDDFTSAIDGLGRARSEIAGDFGLQTAVGDALIRQGRWAMLEGDDHDRAIAGAEHTYAVSAWQTLTPAVWAAVEVAPNQNATDFYCPDYCQYSIDGGRWQLAYGASKDGPGNVLTQGLKDQLFGPTSSGCQQNWDFTSCGLGVPVQDVIRGAGDWRNLQAWTCDVVIEQIVVREPFCNQQR